jgi:hypothetical protein
MDGVRFTGVISQISQAGQRYFQRANAGQSIVSIPGGQSLSKERNYSSYKLRIL